MTVQFPTAIFTPRVTENLPGITYDPTQKQNMFSEDFQNLGAEIEAIETALGENLENLTAQFLPMSLPAKTWTVKTSGGDFTSIQQAIDYFAPFKLAGLQTIQIDSGYFDNLNTEIIFNHIDGHNIEIVGTKYTKTLNSIQSSSGSTGAWSYILNLADVTNIAVNDYILLYNLSGGTNPTFIEGCHKITNVDTVNKRITVTVKAIRADYASGAVATAALQVIKTIVRNTGSPNIGFEIRSNIFSIRNIVCEGYNGTDVAGFIFNGNVNVVFNCNFLGASNYGNGFYQYSGGCNFTITESAFSGCGNGLVVNNRGFLYAYSIGITGNQVGLVATNGGMISVLVTTPNGNVSNYSPTIDTMTTDNNF